MPRFIVIFPLLFIAASPLLAQTVTTNYSAGTAAPEPTSHGKTLFDYVRPWFGGSDAAEPEAAPAEASPPVKAVDRPAQTHRKKRRHSARLAQPAPVTKQAPAAAVQAAVVDSDAQTDALSQCLTSAARRAVLEGRDTDSAKLMADAADGDCASEFRALATAVRRGNSREAARERLKAIIEAQLTPAVEAAVAEAKAR